MKSLEPLDSDLGHDVRELATVLRRLFDSLSVGVRRYAARRSRDAGSVSRYLNGTRIPPWEFVADLLTDVAEVRGAVTPEVVAMVRQLHGRALAASGSPQHRVQLLELELAEADRAARRTALRERALEDALLDAQHRIADLEVQLRQLAAAPSLQRTTSEPEWVQDDDLTNIRQERDDLKSQVEDLRVELKEAHIRRIEAEQRCEELEREIEAADGESVFRDGAPLSEKGLPPGESELSRDGMLDGIDSQYSSNLKAKYSFENFAADSNNRFAQGAAVEAAEAPGNDYNPLYIYGSTGRGKTHLLHAIGNYHRNLYPKSRTWHLSIKDIIEEAARKPLEVVHPNRARRNDSQILLIDDFDYLEGRSGPQEGLAKFFQRALAGSKQLVFASARPVEALSSLSPALVAILQGGLCIGMDPPDPLQLLSILEKKAQREGFIAPTDALLLIAEQAGSSIRELEGALTRVVSYAGLNRLPIDVGLVQQVLITLKKDGSEEATAERVIWKVAEHFDVSVEDLRGTQRGRMIVEARHVAMYLCRELTDHSVPTIAALLGSKNPAAVLHAHKKIRALMNRRPSVYRQITEITNKILFIS